MGEANHLELLKAAYKEEIRKRETRIAELTAARDILEKEGNELRAENKAYRKELAKLMSDEQINALDRRLQP